MAGKMSFGVLTVGSLLLGLYDAEGLLHHVGFTSGIAATARAGLTKKLERLIEPPGFSGSAPTKVNSLESWKGKYLATAQAQPCGRSSLRPRKRQSLSPRHKIPPLAAGQGAKAVYDGSDLPKRTKSVAAAKMRSADQPDILADAA